ncbi:Hypothetical predicted protein [Podarcis lilfordi]|uniref:Secreted protein n=1 Tax=Podarcis lilfordi TaxID=74358 RepID=A0AA35P0X7_9SAUR|nr:Hypothetical predicted protein [Podarcis lilfordi]
MDLASETPLLMGSWVLTLCSACTGIFVEAVEQDGDISEVVVVVEEEEEEEVEEEEEAVVVVVEAVVEDDISDVAVVVRCSSTPHWQRRRSSPVQSHSTCIWRYSSHNSVGCNAF